MLKILIPFLILFSLTDAKATETPFLSAFEDYSGGLNKWVAPVKLKKNQFTEWLNFDATTESGALATRRGFTTKISWYNSNAIKDFFIYDTDAGTFYVASDGDSLRYTLDGVTWTVMASSLPQNTRFAFEVCNGVLWAVSRRTTPLAFNKNTVYTLDGSSLKVGNPPRGASVIAYWKSRVWLANTASDPTSIWYSALTDYNTGAILDPVKSNAFNSLNKIYISKGSGNITALKPYAGFLYVFSDSEIYRINFNTMSDGTDIPDVHKITSSVGCLSAKSITEINNSLVFLGSDSKMYQLAGTQVQQIGKPIDELISTAEQQGFLGGDGLKIFSTKTDLQTGTITGNFQYDENGQWINVISNPPAIFEQFSEYASTTNIVQDYQKEGVWYRLVENRLPGEPDAPRATKNWYVSKSTVTYNTGLFPVMIYGSLFSFISSTSTAQPNANHGFWMIADKSAYPTGTNLQRTFGLKNWTGSFKSTGNNGVSVVVPYVHYSTYAVDNTYIDFALGFGLKSSASGGSVTDLQMCIFEYWPIATYPYGQWTELKCNTLNVVGNLCVPNLNSSTYITNVGNYTQRILEGVTYRDYLLGYYDQKAFIGSFTWEIRPDGYIEARAIHNKYGECYQAIDANYYESNIWKKYQHELAYTTGFATFVKGDRVIPGDPQMLSIDNIYQPVQPSSGTWTSPAIAATNISAWGDLGASINVSTRAYSENDGSQLAIVQSSTFSYRTSPTGTGSWTAYTAIKPNTLLTATTAAYIQLKVDAITTKSTTTFPSIGGIYVGWQTAASTAGYATSALYDNNYYLSVSTQSGFNSIFKLALLPDAHWEYYSVPATSVLSRKGLLYGSTAQNIIQIETGTTDNGAAIDYRLTTGDLTEGYPFFPKYVQYAILDYEKSVSTVTVGISADNGMSWTEQDLYLNYGSVSTTRGIQRINFSIEPCSAYRLRIKRKSGAPVTIYGVSVAGYTSDTITEF